MNIFPMWLKIWNPTFCDSLMLKIQNAASRTYPSDYQGPNPFADLYAALNSYRVLDRHDELVDFFLAIHPHLAMHNVYGVPGFNEQSLHADQIYSAGGFMQATLLRPADYYDDIVPATGFSGKIRDDIEMISCGMDVETSRMKDLIEQNHKLMKPLHVQLLYNPPEPKQMVTQDDLKAKVFDELNWGPFLTAFDLGSIIGD